MSIEIHELQRISLTTESLANFATDLTASATYQDLPFQAGTAQLALNKEKLEPQTAQQLIDGYAKGVIGPKQAQMTVTCVLAPTGVIADDGNDSIALADSAMARLLSLVFGGAAEAQTGSTFATVTDADTFTFTSGTDLSYGQAVGWLDSSGVYHAREIGATPVPKQAFPAAPSVSDDAYAATTIYLEDNPTNSIQMIVEGAEQSDRWLLMGGQVTSTPVITVPIGGLPTIQFTITFADWAQEPEAAITVATYSNFEPEYVHGYFRAQVGGTTTLQNLAVASIQYTLNSPFYIPVTSPSGVNTIARWRRARGVPAAEVTITLPHEDATWFTERDDQDYYHLAQQIGTSPGRVVMLTVPKAEVWNVQLVDQGGLHYQQVSFRATNDTYAGGTSSARRRSAMRIHFL